jgi:hypothetical protein
MKMDAAKFKLILSEKAKLAEEFGFEEVDGCWNCKNSYNWDYRGNGECEFLYELLKERIGEKADIKDLFFEVYLNDKCDKWDLMEEEDEE